MAALHLPRQELVSDTITNLSRIALLDISIPVGWWWFTFGDVSCVVKPLRERRRMLSFWSIFTSFSFPFLKGFKLDCCCDGHYSSWGKFLTRIWWILKHFQGRSRFGLYSSYRLGVRLASFRHTLFRTSFISQSIYCIYSVTQRFEHIQDLGAGR